jgi:hypothetical protein
VPESAHTPQGVWHFGSKGLRHVRVILMSSHADTRKKVCKEQSKKHKQKRPAFFLRSQQVHFERARAASISGWRAQVPIKVLIGKIPSEN